MQDQIPIGALVHLRRIPDRSAPDPIRYEPPANKADESYITSHESNVQQIGFLTATMSKDTEWIEDTNEVLQALQLPRITTNDFPGLGQYHTEIDSRRCATSADAAQSKSRRVTPTSRKSDTTKTPNRLRSGRSNAGSGAFSAPVLALDTAGSILGLLAIATQMIPLFPDFKSTPESILRISRRLEDLAPLLEQVADLIATGADLRPGQRILERTESLLAEIHKTLKAVRFEGRSNLAVTIRWTFRKDGIERLLEEMESLKLSMIFTLQAQMAKDQSEANRAMREGVKHLDDSLQMLRTSMHPMNGKAT